MFKGIEMDVGGDKDNDRGWVDLNLLAKNTIR